MVGDVSQLDLHDRTFDLLLMADLIHRLDNSVAASILKLSRDITHRNVIVMEPLASQDNFLETYSSHTTAAAILAPKRNC